MAAEVDCSKEAVTRQLRVLDSTSASAQERVRAIDALATIGKARTRELPDPIPLVKCLRWLLTSRNVWTRVAALRVLRSFAHDKGFLTCCWEHNLNWFVSRSMDRSSDREKRVEKERSQAYKVVQRCVELLSSQHRADVETYETYPERETASTARSSIHHSGTSILSMSPTMIGSSPFGRSVDSSIAPFSVPLHQDSLILRSPQHLKPNERCQSHDTSSGSGSSHQTDYHYPDLPRGIIQRLATTADNKEDSFNKQAIPLLRDLLVCSPSSLSNANAIKSLVNVLCNPDQVEHHSGIVWAIVYALDNPEHRAHIRVQLDIQQIFAPFAEKVGKDTSDLKKRLKCARDNILLLLRSWAGLFFLASNPAGLRALVDTLRMPGVTFRKMIVFETIHLAIKAAAPLRGIPQTGPWTDYGENTQPKDGYRAPGHHLNNIDDDNAQTTNTSTRLTSDDRRHATVSACVGYSCLDVFLGSLLLVLENAGLHKALMGLVRASMDSEINTNTTAETKGDCQSQQPVLISQAAAHLLQTSLLLSDSLFPSDFSERLYNSFDRVIAGMLVNGKGLHTASKVRSMTTSLFHKIAYGTAAPKKAVRLDSIKLQMSSNMEDAQFRILLNDSQVTTTKDWNKWNCETALFLIKGPLRLHTRLQETLKTKFFKRFLTFIKPRRRLFSELPYKEENLVYSTVACGLIDLLLQSREGALYLSQSGLLEEIRAILNEVNDVATATAEREKVLCKERVMYFMARDYFKMIGKCSESPLGVELLTQHKIFKSLQVLMEKSKTRDRDDVCHQILKHLNFGRFGSRTVTPEAKQIFANAMAEGSRPIRLFATLQLRNSFRFGYRDSDWALLLLVAQLSDSWREVAKAAHEIINEWCMLNDTVLDRFINERPGMGIFTKKDDAEEHTQKLLLRMLTRDAGFNYLHELGVVQVQLQEWRSVKAVEWVVTLEKNLSAALFPIQKPDFCSSASLPKRRARMLETSSNQNTVIYPPHFFGELAKTTPGTQFLKDNNVLQDQQDIILAAMEENDRLQFQSQEASCGGGHRSNSLDIPNRRLASTTFDDAMMHSVSAWVHEEEDIIKDLPGEQRSRSNTPNKTDRLSERVTKRSPATVAIQHTDPKFLGLEPPKASPQADKIRQKSIVSLNIESVDYTSKQPETPVLRVRNSVQLRAALWSVAFMASSDTGFEFIETQPGGLMLIQTIVSMATSADTLSLRGALMSIVSVIGQSKLGAAHLRKLGWDTSHGDGYNTSDGAWCGCSFTHPVDYDSWKEISYKPFSKQPCQIVHPDNIIKEKQPAESVLSQFNVTAVNAPEHFQDMEDICQQAAAKGLCSYKEAKRFFGILLVCHHRDRSAMAKKKDTKEKCAYDVVLNNVETMANPVMIDTSSKALKRIKAQDVSIFHDPYLAFAIHDVLNTYSFRATTRKYLYDTFADHAVYCHEAFAYLDASLYPTQTVTQAPVDPPTTTTTTAQLENHSFNGSSTSTRSSPVPRPVSPALSKPYERISPIALNKMSPPTTPRR